MFEVRAPLGHRETIEGLWRARARGRLPHALLFEGTGGIGKFMAALWFAQGLFCEDWSAQQLDWSGPCGSCGPCKRFAARSHPDFFLLDPVEEALETIKIGTITERDGGEETVHRFFSLRPMEGGARVVIIREFDRAEAPAQNALLKILEEPGEGALLILETSRPDLLMETIRSRCVTVHFDALSETDCGKVLLGSGVNQTQLIPWAGGSPGKVLALSAEGAPAVRALLEEVLEGRLMPLAATRRVLEVPGEFSGKTPTAQLRARTRAALDLLLAVLRDGVRLAEGLPVETLAHGDLVSRALRERVRWSRALEQVVALRGEVELNLTPEGILDRALLALPLPPLTSNTLRTHA